MSFATADDIAARLGRDLAAGETEPVDLLLEGATAMIAEAAGQDDDWSDALTPVPRVLKFVCIEAVCRAMANPQGIASLQEQLGAYSSTVHFRDLDMGGGLWLTDAERRQIRRVIGAGTFQAITLETPYSGTALDEQPELPLL